MLLLPDFIFGNTLYDQSMVQLLYNIIHWILGANLVAFAILEYRKNRTKITTKKARLIGPALFAFNGLFFVGFVLIGHILYLQIMDLPWKFDHEHTTHVLIGSLLAAGGTVELLYRTKRLHHWHWHFALPLSLIAGGLGFLHPQHGLGSVLEYMTTYHRILATCLILSGISLGVAYYINNERKILYISLAFIVLSGAVFIAYRHQYNTEATCNARNAKIYDIQVANGRAEPRTIDVELCDKIRFISNDNERHSLNFGAHAHHDNYLDFESELLEEKSDFQEISMTISGTFYFHDHLNHAINGYITVKRPKDLSDWQVVKY